MGEKEKEKLKEIKQEQPVATSEPQQETNEGNNSGKEEDEVATEV